MHSLVFGEEVAAKFTSKTEARYLIVILIVLIMSMALILAT
jgi:hypothetical protein